MKVHAAPLPGRLIGTPAPHCPANDNHGKDNEQQRYDDFEELCGNGGNSVRLGRYKFSISWCRAFRYVDTRWLGWEEREPPAKEPEDRRDQENDDRCHCLYQ